ncbi:MAG TPA: hypothetical protein DEP84_19075 [Chloroflexi bacterium]|nr:hypothetical protein [Chloroflexota bacterium]
MQQSRWRLATLLILSLLLAVAPVALAQGPDRTDPRRVDLRQAIRTATLHRQAIEPSAEDLPAAPRNEDPNRIVSAYIVLAGSPAVEAALSARPAAAQSVAGRLSQIRAQQTTLAPRLTALGARTVYSYQRLANAIQVRIPAGKLAAIAALPSVSRVDLVGRYGVENATSVPLIGAPVVWDPADLGAAGEGISIGIIDTGIDYTHADFGGSGVAGDYTADDPDIIEPGSFPTAKIVGGYDFVGDDYDAGSTDPVLSTPAPDPDPLDCYGHGTHVAGTAAGIGILSNGTTYTSTYDSGIDLTQFAVAPGVAPKADLYALKIFGCRGSTDLLGAAYEWAADPNGDGDFSDHLDVLNLSLGCDFSCGSPTELAMTNLLAQLGTFIAVAAGNAGNTFYVSGDPASADRALAVAASIESGLASGTMKTQAIDQIADFSARGPGSPDSRLKPEIAAPGVSIYSAAIGTGNKGLALNGTSMATPHIAGAAALMKQVHPAFTVEEIKANLMNTARETHDPRGNPEPESRTGAGRVRVDIAGHTQVTAAAERVAGAVALSFGALTLASGYTETQSVRLTNHGSTPVRYTISVSETVTETGVALLPLLHAVTVPAYGSVTIPFRFTADPGRFDMTSDPTTPATQFGQARHSLYEVSGQIHFDGESQPIHLPYYATVYAAAEMHAETTEVAALPGGSSAATVTIPITGTSAHPLPLVTAFQLGAESPDLHLSDPLMANADLLAVGAASDIATTGFFTETTVYFGIATAGQWTTPQPYLAEFDIHIDTNRDGTDDYVLFNWNRGAAAQSGTRNATDTFVTVLFNLSTGQAVVDSFLNIVPANVLDTAPFNNSVAVLPVSAESLGLKRGEATFDYTVASFGASGLVDQSPTATFDAANPLIDTAATGLSGLPVHMDGAPVQVNVNRAALASTFTHDRPARVLLLHHMNTAGKRMEIITVRGGGFELFLPLLKKDAPR